MHARPWNTWKHQFLTSTSEKSFTLSFISWYRLNSCKSNPRYEWTVHYQVEILKCQQTIGKKCHTMYSKTKYSTSFSLITSFSFTIFGWFIFFSDCQGETHQLLCRNNINLSSNNNQKGKCCHLDFSQINTFFPWIIFLLHFFDRNLSMQLISYENNLKPVDFNSVGFKLFPKQTIQANKLIPLHQTACLELSKHFQRHHCQLLLWSWICINSSDN